MKKQKIVKIYFFFLKIKKLIFKLLDKIFYQFLKKLIESKQECYIQILNKIHQ